MRVNRNYFGRQTESFEIDLDLPFLSKLNLPDDGRPFPGVFIRAPIVEKILPSVYGEQTEEAVYSQMVVAPAKDHQGSKTKTQQVEVLAKLPGRDQRSVQKFQSPGLDQEAGSIIAVRQGNCFGTSFHPELTFDTRIHAWWLKHVEETVQR